MSLVSPAPLLTGAGHPPKVDEDMFAQETRSDSPYTTMETPVHTLSNSSNESGSLNGESPVNSDMSAASNTFVSSGVSQLGGWDQKANGFPLMSPLYMEHVHFESYEDNVKARVTTDLTFYERIGNYHIECVLAEGRFSDVYLGRHVTTLDKVAVKILKTENYSFPSDNNSSDDMYARMALAFVSASRNVFF
jgi:hypothetical protein